MKNEKSRSLDEILMLRKNVLAYPEVKFAYELNGMGDSFKFRTAEDVKKVLRWDVPIFQDLMLLTLKRRKELLALLSVS